MSKWLFVGYGYYNFEDDKDFIKNTSEIWEQIIGEQSEDKNA